MIFNEVVPFLLKGSKIRRKDWPDSAYLLYSKETKTPYYYEEALQPYEVTPEIIVSGGWYVEEDEKPFYFYQVLEPLQKGCKVRLNKQDKSKYIYYDRYSRQLVFRTMEVTQHAMSIQEFMAHDWMIIDD